MRRLFWLTVGVGLGAFGYRYYQENGGRLPILEQLMGRDTDELANQATQTLRSAQRGAEQAVSESVSNVAREAVTSVAEEITEAEHAKRREHARRSVHTPLP